MSFSDQELLDFLSCALPKDRTEALEAELAAGNTKLDARLRKLDPFAGHVRAAFDALPVDQRIEAAQVHHVLDRSDDKPVQIDRAPRWAGWQMAASLLVGLTLGAGGFHYLAPQPAPNGWRAQVAQYQALYVPQTVAHVETASLETQFNRADTALGSSLPWTTLSEIRDLELVRVQVLGFNGNPLIQIVYKDETGTPYALCLMLGEDGVRKSEHLKGLASTAWSGGGARIILIGGTDLERIESLAEPLQDALT